MAKSIAKDWTNKRTTLVEAVAVVASVFLAFFLNRPEYYPSAIFQPRNGDEAQRIAELSAESKTCDTAIRALILAVGSEISNDKNLDPLEKVRSLVDSDFALVPPPCQQVIDPLSTSSDGDLEVAVLSARSNGYSLIINLRIHNTGEEPVFVGYDPKYDNNIIITDDRGIGVYRHYDVGGVYVCSYTCNLEEEARHFTKIDPGAAASITAKGKLIVSSYDSPKTASLVLTLLTAKDGDPSGTLSFGFDGVPLN